MVNNSTNIQYDGQQNIKKAKESLNSDGQQFH